jgi:cytochrome c-type biogenesis protein CcmE
MSKGVQIAGGATLIALLLGWYATTNIEGGASFTYYQNLSDFQAAADASSTEIGRMSRVHGYVLPGSIERDVAQLRVGFAVQNEPPHAGGPPGTTLAVLYGSLETPDLFKDGAEVVVEGQLVRRDGEVVFHADRVMAKCPSKFAPETPQAASL